MDLAKAYVQIIPSAEGMSGQLADIFSGEGTSAGKTLGENVASGAGSALRTGAKVIAGAATVAVAGAAAIGTGAYKMASSVAEYGDMIDKNSQKMGVSSTFYQEWDAVLQHSGTSMESMSTTFKTLANAAQDASADQEAAFARLGLSMDQVSSMSAEDLFANVIYGLQNMEEGTERTALATDLLGRGAMEMGALLNTSAEDTQGMISTVHELGGVMSEEAVADAAAFQDALQDAKTVVGGLKNSIGAEVMPVITEAFQWIADNSDVIREKLSGVFVFISTVVSGVAEFISGHITDIQAAIEFAWGIISQVFSAISEAVETVTASMDGASISWSTVWSGIGAFIQTAANLICAAIQLIGVVIGWLVTEAQTDGTLINGIWQNIQLVFSTAAAVIQGIIDALTAVLQGDWSAAGTAISGIVSAMWNGIQTYFTNGSNVAKNIITNLGSAILSTLSGLASSAWTWGSDLLSNFIAGIRSKIASLISSVSSIASTVRSYLGFSEPELGPLSNFHTYAPDMMDLFMEGVEQKTPELVQTISGAFGQARNAIGTLPAEFSGAPASYTAQEQDSRALGVLMDILEVLRQIRNSDNGAGVSMNDLIDIFDERMGATALRLERGN